MWVEAKTQLILYIMFVLLYLFTLDLYVLN